MAHCPQYLMPRPKQLEPKVTVVEKVRLQRDLAAARAQPHPPTWKALAAKHGLPVRTIQRYHTRYIEQQAFDDDPLGLVNEGLDLYAAVIERAAEELEAADNSNAAIGAMRLILDTMGRRLNLLIQVGRMPRNMVDFENVGAINTMILGLSEIVEKHDLPNAVIDDLLSVVESVRRTP